MDGLHVGQTKELHVYAREAVSWWPNQALDFRDVSNLSHYRFIQIHSRSRVASTATSHTQKYGETREFLGGDGIAVCPDGSGDDRNQDMG